MKERRRGEKREGGIPSGPNHWETDAERDTERCLYMGRYIFEKSPNLHLLSLGGQVCWGTFTYIKWFAATHKEHICINCMNINTLSNLDLGLKAHLQAPTTTRADIRVPSITFLAIWATYAAREPFCCWFLKARVQTRLAPDVRNYPHTTNLLSKPQDLKNQPQIISV